MSEFWMYFNIGLKHVLDINAYDHVLFLMALVVPYAFKDWKNVFVLVSLFTLGHTLALLLSVYGVVQIQASLVEFLIPITILKNITISSGSATSLNMHMNINEWLRNPNTFNFNTDGNYIMGDSTAMNKITQNGHDVFSF